MYIPIHTHCMLHIYRDIHIKRHIDYIDIYSIHSHRCGNMHYAFTYIHIRNMCTSFVRACLYLALVDCFVCTFCVSRVLILLGLNGFRFWRGSEVSPVSTEAARFLAFTTSSTCRGRAACASQRSALMPSVLGGQSLTYLLDSSARQFQSKMLSGQSLQKEPSFAKLQRTESTVWYVDFSFRAPGPVVAGATALASSRARAADIGGGQ